MTSEQLNCVYYTLLNYLNSLNPQFSLVYQLAPSWISTRPVRINWSLSRVGALTKVSLQRYIRANAHRLGGAVLIDRDGGRHTPWAVTVWHTEGVIVRRAWQ